MLSVREGHARVNSESRNKRLYNSILLFIFKKKSSFAKKKLRENGTHHAHKLMPNVKVIKKQQDILTIVNKSKLLCYDMMSV